MRDIAPGFPVLRIERGSCADPLENLFENVLEAPEALYIRARADALDALAAEIPRRGLAIVGTRRAQGRSIELTRRVVEDLGPGSRLVVISGLARGIDAEAHEAALDCGMPTIGVLAGGLDEIYPPQNRALALRILEEGGALVSEFPPGVRPRPGMFLKRNRLIAAWASATWVVEASFRSGALNTAAWARLLDRDVYSTPCFPEDPALAGNQRLIDEMHARPAWNASSFGQTWIDLAARVSTRAPAPAARLDRDSREGLPSAVNALTARNGAAGARDLLDWALARGWSAERFYSELHSKIKFGEILEKNGRFVLASPAEKVGGLKNPRESD